MAYAIKADVRDPDADTFAFPAHKSMYGGKRIAVGDVVFVFASENSGGRGLVVRAVVVAADPVARRPDLDRQTPRVSVTVRATARATCPLGRRELAAYADWGDGRPESELNFKLYRQATDKIVGLSAEVAAFLDGFF